MSTTPNAAWLLASRPAGMATGANFEWRETALPALADGQVKVRNIWLSIDPTNRIWMNDADSYLPKIQLGEVMRGICIGRVEESRDGGFQPGDVVQGLLGWQRYYVGPAQGLTKMAPIPLPLSAHFGLLGHIGLTAYFGLTDVAQAKAGETLVVSAAAGAVGSLAVQIGKNLGMRVVAIAGGAEKCRWVKEELGADAVIDYKAEDVAAGLKRACPDGIDVDFENVGGRTLEAVLGRINLGARIALCGMISQYNATGPEPGPSNLANLLMQRGRIQGFIVLDYLGRAREAAEELIGWHLAGRMKYRLDVSDGLELAPAALGKLFTGANTGKVLVKVSEE
jgi:NADPH-dependent curcumin reductase CurA